jgi:hypothetical protein
MKQLVVLTGCVIILSALAGCQNANPGAGNRAGANEKFPKVMVGVWEVEVTRRSKWGIKFEADGSILKIIHTIVGPVTLAQGQIYEEGPDEGTYAVFVMGPCETEYIAGTRILKVKLVLDHFKMVLPNGELEGRTEDYFQGPVSPDGKTWDVEWRSYGWLEGAQPPDVNLIEANPVPLAFTKLDIK